MTASAPVVCRRLRVLAVLGADAAHTHGHDAGLASQHAGRR